MPTWWAQKTALPVDWAPTVHQAQSLPCLTHPLSDSTGYSLFLWARKPSHSKTWGSLKGLHDGKFSPYSWKMQSHGRSRMGPRGSVTKEFRQLSPWGGAVPEGSWHLMPVAEGPHWPCQTQLPVAPRDLGLWALFFGRAVIDVYDSSWANREHFRNESTFLDYWKVEGFLFL